MSARTPTTTALRTLLRASTTPLRTTAPSPTSPTSQFPSSPTTRALSHLRQRSPSPPALHLSGKAASRPGPSSQSQWTHFTTPYSYTSIRTFTRSPSHLQSPPPPPPPQAQPPATATPTKSSPSTTSPSHATATTSPEAAQRIEEVVEEITELYGTARDEFEIATEETEKNSTYAPDDRAAAREELDQLLVYYNGVLEGGDRAVAEEVKRRVGQRVRELERGVEALEESVLHGE